jgi:hypothetical protein
VIGMGSIRLMAVIGVLLTAATSTMAHSLIISWENTATHFTVKVTFDSDDPADDCEVKVIHEDGRELATMKTDKDGHAIFKRPPTGNYTITADAGSGHFAKKTIAFTDRVEAFEKIDARWPRVLMGLGIIAVLTIGWQLLSRKK